MCHLEVEEEQACIFVSKFSGKFFGFPADKASNNTMLLLTELEVHTRNICSDIQGPKAVRSIRLECQNKYFPHGPKSRLIRALLYTYTIK